MGARVSSRNERNVQEHSVLVVEDESIVAMDIERRLSRMGYKIAGTAANAEAAMVLVDSLLPDLILMDIHIQGNVDGIDIAMRIHGEYHIPVIFLTAFSEDATLARARAAKPYGYLLKPFSERDLHASIQVALERFEYDLRLRKSETHLKLALDAAQMGTWELGASDPLIFGYKPDGILSPIPNWAQFAQTIRVEDRAKVEDSIALLRDKNSATVEIEFQIDNPALGHRWMMLYGKTYVDKNAFSYRAVGVLQDVTSRRLMEGRLRQAAMVYQCSADGIVILDANRRVISANEALYRMTGFHEAAVANQEFAFFSADNLGEERYQEIWKQLQSTENWQGEVRGFCEDGSLIHAWVNVAAVPDAYDHAGQYVLILSDITAVLDAQEKLTHIAYYDSLTGLPNRNLFMDRLDHALAISHRDSRQLALLFIDLDHFKRINDTLGHQVGDKMLRTAANRLRQELRATDTLCRIGGDEFIVIMESLRSANDAEILATKLLAALEKPLLLNGVETVPSASVGISVFPVDSTDRDDLIKMADTAMYAAKNNGRNGYAFYREEMTESTAYYLMRERELRLALSDDQFRVYYQPQFCATIGKLVGLEALIRWHHPDYGMRSAADIIPIAEESTLIFEIGSWIFEAVCKQLAAWNKAGLSPPRIAVNVSVRQLQHRDFVETINSIVQQYGIEFSQLELEVTESCVQDNETVIMCLNALHSKGMYIAIDDFGTGYSCMSSLKSLPIHKLKVDQSFVRDIPSNKNDCAIASAVVAIGKQLQLSVIAEGIETKEQSEFMRQAGCDELQGYLLGSPMPAEEVVQLFSVSNHIV